MTDGKTFTMARWVKGHVENGVKRITLAAPTLAAIRDNLFDGESGILNAYAPNDPDRPIYYSSQGLIRWPKSGATAQMIAAESPSKARGPNSQIIALDEGAACPNGKKFFDDLLMGNRMSPAQTLIATTPLTNDLILDLYKRQEQDVKIRYGSTLENEENLDPAMVKRARTIQKTRYGQQEVDGKILLQSSGAAFNNDMIEKATIHVSMMPPRHWKRCIISLDPAGSNTNSRSDKFGISVMVETDDHKILVLRDLTERYTPDQWSKLVGALYEEFEAICPTKVIFENNGVGMFVGEVLKRDHKYMPVDGYPSTTKKFARLESAAHLFETEIAYFEQDGEFASLFEELTLWEGHGKSPDRADAMSGGINYIAQKDRSKAISKQFLI